MEQKSSSKFWLFMLAIILLAALAGMFYYVLTNKSSDELLHSLQTNIEKNSQVAKNSTIDLQNEQIKQLKSQNATLKQEQNAITSKLLYSIKPKDRVVALCNNMKIGKWKMPKECHNALIEGVKAFINEDNKIVAFEISGIVDNLAYAGTQPELKQEGLASFRAKEAMLEVSKKMPNIAVFEGLSQQKDNKRGFVVRAYYVEK